MIGKEPAFPFTLVDHDGETLSAQPGMSLRDWFAGMALQGLLANMKVCRLWRDVVRDAGHIADEAIEERKEN